MRFTPSNSEQRQHPTYYRGCWHVVSRCFLAQYLQLLRVLTTGIYSYTTEFYDPQAFITHAALLDQGFPHCPIFPTAASRRSLDRVSVPVWLIILSDQLPIVAMVGHYPTIQLMGRELIFQREPKPPLTTKSEEIVVLCGISTSFEMLFPTKRQITHALLTRAPLVLTRRLFPFDLHVLGMPPAFVLSQNQTLQLNLKIFESATNCCSLLL